MSYRKKHYPATPERETPTLFDVEYSNPGVDRTLPTSRLTSGLPYQRPVDEKEVDRLIREWDDRLLEPLTVSFRDGRFNVVDGQHRIAAMVKKNSGREVMVPCKVYSGLSYEEEAALCYKLDKAKRRLSLSQSTNALVESGMDAEATEIRRLVEDAGFRWALGKKSGREHEIVATRAVITRATDVSCKGRSRATHRVTTSRSVRIPQRLPSRSRTGSAPTLCRVISRAATDTGSSGETAIT